MNKFISFEGGEGTGKSTQARLLHNALVNSDRRILLTREPGGTPGAECIRDLILYPPAQSWNIRTEALLFAAARSCHVEMTIKPALAEGKWVICDRYLDSSRAYQGGAGGLPDSTILDLHRIGSNDLLPDLTILIDVPPERVGERLSARDEGASDAIGGRSTAYHSAVADSFRSYADKEPERFVTIDGDGSMSEVHQRVVKVMSERFGVLCDNV